MNKYPSKDALFFKLDANSKYWQSQIDRLVNRSTQVFPKTLLV